MLSRRQTLLLLASLGSASTLSACGPNLPSRSNSDPDTVRTYWWGGDLRHELTQQAFDLFKGSHSGITVTPEYSEWTGYWDKLATQTSGGSMPDLLQMDEKYIDSYGTRGALLDLETLGDVLDLSGMEKSLLDTGRLENGTLVGAPLGTGILSVGVNSDILEASGVDAPEDTSWTWDDLMQTSAQISEWAADEGKDIVGLDGFGQGGDQLAAWARQSGEQVFPRSDETLVSLDTIASFLDYSKKLVDARAVPSVSAQIEDTAAGVEQGLFGTGRSAFHLQFHTQIQTFQTSSKAHMTLWRLPALTSGSPRMVNKASMYWSISSRSRSAQNAGLLMDFLLTDPGAAKALKIERGVTGFPEVQDEIEPDLDEIETVCLDFARDVQKEVAPTPRVTPTSGVGFSDDFTRLSQAYYFGSQSLEDAAQAILSSVQGMQS
ncbi:extracellular solute-binding protein [Brachybacterium halotolerans subsp. kimchii]|uniref:ABC transporter substrate-binding protein n=1 Tax=Brachybacterium halotolerans TaxID=2795215 RepID=UPI001E3E638C|nr:extracellular solute-binding protein [Brachybacterium halotolerans]UEJ81956.1 extracellular solute-binding protein [Brachybacterium halotolerans subsp. kimchii]